MRLTYLAAAILFTAELLSHPVPVVGQTQRDSVLLLVGAAQAVLQDLGPDQEIFLDPRSELWTGPLEILVVKEFKNAGIQTYGSPGVPPRNIGLLSPGRIWESPKGTEVSAAILSFGLRTGFLNTQSYRYIFRVNCGELGCSLGEKIGSMHGDGHTAPECWDDFFLRSEERRKECRGQ